MTCKDGWKLALEPEINSRARDSLPKVLDSEIEDTGTLASLIVDLRGDHSPPSQIFKIGDCSTRESRVVYEQTWVSRLELEFDGDLVERGVDLDAEVGNLCNLKTDLDV